MCFLPYMTPIQQTTMAIDAFGGYDHNLRIADGSLYDMKNLTSDNYPVLTPRKQRGTYWPDGWENQPTNVIGACAGAFVKPNGLGGANLVIGDTLIKDLGLTDTEKTIVRNGAYLLIFPDKKYINTVDLEDRGDMEVELNYAHGQWDYPLHLRLHDDRGAFWKDFYSGDLPDTATDGCIYYCSVGNERYIKRWDAEKEKWLDVDKLGLSFYTASPNAPSKDDPNSEWYWFVEEEISEGESVVIPECSYYDGSETVSVWPEEISAAAGVGGEFYGEPVFWITDFNSMLKFCEFWENYSSGFNAAHSENGYYINKFRIERAVPVLDFVLECNNRLWGCRYGNSAYGDFVNELYAAQQGNFKNWYMFAGISTDSYVASCGAPGPFTGAINFNGRPLFFKENHYYLVSGDYPSEYGYSEGPIKGVQNGSGKSLVVIDRVAYYKGVDGVYAFDGYSATCISEVLGDTYYKNARAGAYRNKYYITMQDENDVWNMFVYDTKKGLWHKEDNQQADFFYTDGNILYFVSDGFIQSVDAETLPQAVRRDTPEPPVEWMAETGNLTTGIPYKKYLSKLNVRMKVHKGASVRIFIQYDESGKWEELFYMTATAQRSFTIPIRPKRCDHIKLKLTGVGDVEIYSIIKTLEKGSDL